MKQRNAYRSRRLLIWMTISTILSSTACSSLAGPPVECKRPNLLQKTSWKLLRRTYWRDETFGPAVRWVSEILEEDCFPREAEASRDGS